MPVYLTPGVYRQPQPVKTGRIRLVRTDVAGFVGLAERGPLPRPDATLDEATKAAVRLTGWSQFRSVFGGFVPYGFLAYAVRAFFDNGGAACYVVRTAGLKPGKDGRPPRKASIRIPTMAGVIGPPPAGVSFAAKVAPDGWELKLSDQTAPPAGETEKIQTGDMVQIKSAELTEISWLAGRQGDTLKLGRRFAGARTGNVTVTGYSPGLIVSARSAGTWGNRIKLAATPRKDQEFALRVTLMPGPDPSAPVEEEYYNRLSLKRGPFHVLDRVNAFSNLITLCNPMAPDDIPPLFFGMEKRVPAKTLQDIAEEQQDAFNVAYTVQLRDGEDGLDGLTVEDFTGATGDWRGLRVLEEIDEVSILCVPDAPFERPVASPAQVCPPADQSVKTSSVESSPGQTGNQAAVPPPDDAAAIIYHAMIDQCERLHDRVAILDCPPQMKEFSDLYEWRDRFVTRFAALYYPWLDVPDPLSSNGALRRVPPTGHVAGVYARTDRQFGVHWPPANAALAFVADVADRLTDLGQQRLNPYGINVIRSFPKRGVRIWGARSLAKADDAHRQFIGYWQFIHARRLMSMIEESLSKSMQWAVFESNDFTLRQTLVHSISVFLETVWRSGGLKGSRPGDGFYVKCDETNNPPAVIEAGQMVCEIGVAIAAPMEFLVFEIRRNPSTTEISES